MKRGISFFLIFALLLSGCGSGGGNSSESVSLNFYYCVEDIDQLTSAVAVEAEGRNVQVFTLTQLMDLYLRGPTSDHLRSPFPDGTEMVSLAEGEDGLEVTMSGAFFTLQGIELSVASYCIGKTICDYLGTEQVIVVDEMNRIQMEIAPDDFLLENSFHSESESVFTLYFPDSSSRYLIPETREVTLSENESPETYMLRQLMLGPHSDDLLPSVPEGTRLLRVSTSDGICSVDFSVEFYAAYQDDPYGAYTAIFSIVNTLTGLDAITGVQFLQEGVKVERCGLFSVEKPLTRYLSSVGLVRAGGTELDINVYVLENENEGSFGVPVRVKQTIAQPLAEAVAQAAISFEAPQGFYNPIPYGTELLSISMSGSVCYVDVSRDFIPSDGAEFSEQAAVWALVTGLTDQDNISSVVLTIEGESGGMQYVDISEPLTAESVTLD